MSNAGPLSATLLERAPTLRHKAAPAEATLWQLLRDRQLGGHKFRRQRPVPPFIADFACVKLGLIVELDGDSHAGRLAYDDRRTARLNEAGFHVLRFSNVDVR